MITLPNPCSGTHWLISPNVAKWSRNIERMMGSKNDLGSEVTASVFVGRLEGGDVGEDDPERDEGRDLAIVDDDVQRGLVDGSSVEVGEAAAPFLNRKFSARGYVNNGFGQFPFLEAVAQLKVSRRKNTASNRCFNSSQVNILKR